MRQADDQIRRGNCPRDECHRFVKIVDGTLFEIEPAQNHRRRMQRKCGEQKKIIYVVIAAKSAAPQKNRIDRAPAIKNHGEQKEMPVNKPVHIDRLNHRRLAAIQIHFLQFKIAPRNLRQTQIGK